MKIEMLMDKHMNSDTQWCGTWFGVFGTITTIIRGYKFGYRRFEFGKCSK